MSAVLGAIYKVDRSQAGSYIINTESPIVWRSKEMKKKAVSSDVHSQMKDFLKENPKIAQALHAFNISYRQYERALEGRVRYYTASSTHQAGNLCVEDDLAK